MALNLILCRPLRNKTTCSYRSAGMFLEKILVSNDRSETDFSAILASPLIYLYKMDDNRFQKTSSSTLEESAINLLMLLMARYLFVLPFIKPKQISQSLLKYD